LTTNLIEQTLEGKGTLNGFPGGENPKPGHKNYGSLPQVIEGKRKGGEISSPKCVQVRKEIAGGRGEKVRGGEFSAT